MQQLTHLNVCILFPAFAVHRCDCNMQFIFLSLLTAIPQSYRTYSGNFKRLTDIVRCCLVVDTPEDMLKLVQVRCLLPREHFRSDCTSQKILDNSKHCDASKPSLSQRVKSLWNFFLVQVLGLTPIPKKKEHQGNSDGEVEGAFELLRVCVLSPHHAPSFFQPPAGAQPLCLQHLCWWLPRHELQNSRWVHV